MYGSLVKTFSVAAVTAAILFAGSANAQTVCGKRADIISQLEQKYGETRRSIGVQRGRGVVEVYASAETGSWTILITDPRGMSCLMAAGEAFEFENLSQVDTPT